jgi:hypothetical protein
MSPDYQTLNALKFGALNNALWNGIKFEEFQPNVGRFDRTLFHSIGHYSSPKL